MKRRLFNALVAMSMLQTALAGAMWVRSHWRRDVFQVSWTSPDVNYRDAANVTFGRSGVSIGYDCYEPNGNPAGATRSWSRRSYPHSPPSFGRLMKSQVTFESTDWKLVGKGPTLRYRAWTMPHWVYVVPSLLMPAIWWIGQRRRAQRVKSGQCARCGYDLRATPERCPECGAAAGGSGV